MLISYFANLLVLYGSNSIINSIDSQNDSVVIIIITNISSSRTLRQSDIKPSISLLYIVLVQQNNIVIFTSLLQRHSLYIIYEVDNKIGKILKSVFNSLNNLRKNIKRLNSNVYISIALIDFDIFSANKTLQKL